MTRGAGVGRAPGAQAGAGGALGAQAACTGARAAGTRAHATRAAGARQQARGSRPGRWARSLCARAGPVGCSCTRLGFQPGFSTQFFFPESLNEHCFL